MKPTIEIENNLSLIKDSSQYTCSILVGRNYLSYVLSDEACENIYMLKHYYFENKVIGKKDFNEILNNQIFKKVGKVKIAIDSVKSTLVPDIYYEDNYKETYFNLFHELLPEENLHTQKLTSNKTSIYSLKKSTVSFLSSIYKDVSFYDAASCLLNKYPKVEMNDAMHTFFICVKDDYVSMSVYHQKQLVFHHIYEEAAPSDMNYYISNFISLHKIDFNKVDIQLHGETLSINDVYAELENYYRNLKYCSRVPHLQYPESLHTQPAHYFFNLFSLMTCE